MNYATSYHDSTVDLTTSEVEVLEINENRKILMLFNVGPEAARIMFSAGSDCYIELPAGQGLNLDKHAPLNPIYAKAATGTATLNVVEG